MNLKHLLSKDIYLVSVRGKGTSPIVGLFVFLLALGYQLEVATQATSPPPEVGDSPASGPGNTETPSASANANPEFSVPSQDQTQSTDLSGGVLPEAGVSTPLPAGGSVEVEDQGQDKAMTPVFSDFQTFLEPFIYDPKNRKDPFKPYVESTPVDQGELQGPLLPLQRFDTSEIRLVGIIWDVAAPKAMFLDPTNTVHIIGKNERIGRNNGYVAMIREGEVVVIEATRKEDEVIYTTTVMKITR
ncbi:MAG: pilus assembly protein PilP [Bdellovibrionales bacterium]|nr:pilus assembly protein PilP [Bdellovibrionales bacterium]